MDICIIGAGVIGSIYGHVLADAGHDVTHFVRPGRGVRLRLGIDLELLDARSGEAIESRTTYRPSVVERLDPNEPHDLILASVRHYQVPDLVPVLASGAGEAHILFFNNLWTTFEPIDAQLRGRYSWGFPVAGGGFDGRHLEAALLGEVHLGEPAGGSAERIDQVRELFAGTGLEVRVQPDILAWLWVHFAIEAGVVATAIKAGGVPEFLGNVDRIAEAVRAVRDGLAIVRARGIDVDAHPDARMFAAPERAVAQGIKDMYVVDRAARRIMERHTGGEELRRIYFDVVQTGRDLGIDLPVLGSLGPFVEAFVTEAA